MKKILLILIAIFSLILLNGCGTTGKFVYPDQMSSLFKESTGPIAKKSVAVIPFDDYRNNDNSCLYPIYLIPLMPFGWGEYERPEAASMFLSINKYEVTPSEDLAKATAVSLRHSNIFRDSFFTMGGEKQNADYVLSGKINTMAYEGKLYSYGLSAYGPALWFLGAPAGSSTNKLSLELYLKNHQGDVLWQWSTTREESIIQWLYARTGYDCKLFSKIYQDSMNEAMQDLVNTIQQNPDLFK